MTFEQTSNIISNIGVPSGILIWFVWRGDFYLRRLVDKLDKFNDKLDAINLSLRDFMNKGEK